MASEINVQDQNSNTHTVLDHAFQSIFDVFIDALSEVVCIKDARGRWILANDKAVRLFRLEHIDWQGKTDRQLSRINPELAELYQLCMSSDEEAWTGKYKLQLQTYPIHLSGEDCVYEVRKIPLFYPDGQRKALIIIANNRSQSEKSNYQIQIFSQVIEQSPMSVLITNPEGKIEYVNLSFEKVSGYTKQDVIGKTPRVLKSNLTPRHVYESLWKTITGGESWTGEFRNRKKNGDLYWEYAHIAPVINEQGKISHYIAVKEDITIRKEQELHILYQANYDTLTGLPNRFFIHEKLKNLIIESRRNNDYIAVLFLDFDDFKKVNDSLGHETGDQFLIQSAERINQVIRRDDFLGRLGGDEFLVLLGGLKNVMDAAPIAQKILDQFNQAVMVDGRELFLTTSIGIAIFPDDGDNASDLLRKADAAMYHSKDNGYNTYSFFTEEVNDKIARRLLIEEQMFDALNRDEFELYYQPQYDLFSRQLIGVEVLLRWNNKVFEHISPDEFISIAEATGLIVPIGEWVLDRAIKHIAKWNKQFRQSIRVAINVSPRQIRDESFIYLIEATLSKYQLSGQYLEVEITEGMLLNDHLDTKLILTQLRQLGISIAIDDFGTGYSSLSYLREYPFNIMKIDKSFICQLENSQENKTLITAAIGMAHGLGLKVVAEGVENQQQLDYLLEKECDIVQGYFFSKPLSSKMFQDLLAKTQ